MKIVRNVHIELKLHVQNVQLDSSSIKKDVFLNALNRHMLMNRIHAFHVKINVKNVASQHLVYLAMKNWNFLRYFANIQVFHLTINRNVVIFHFSTLIKLVESVCENVKIISIPSMSMILNILAIQLRIGIMITATIWSHNYPL